VSLELSLEVVLIVEDDSLVGDRDEDLLSRFIGKVVDAIVNVVVESQGPFEFES
jgi:hypothetical protein